MIHATVVVPVMDINLQKRRNLTIPTVAPPAAVVKDHR
jgi:hypothetical protein